ncbi:hypothetical protein ATCC90586_009547 [Pythium insidiosum]|nr:hypothetical protein ATCC90586_009547 [Pythium insidiosum]
MSLFQVREWWATKSEHREEFSYGGLLVGNVDNDSGGQAKIVTGSLNGTLRIYLPTQNEFKIEHLLLEESLGHPILQLALGYFIPNQRILALAVLHPRRLGVYVVEGVGGNGMSANYFRITQRYEHRLGIDGEHFTAFNMIHGPFGTTGVPRTGAPGAERDHLCVQSLDGRLQFFEQDRFAFLQPLNNSFVPGPICYANGMDAIIAATSDLQLECYRYQVLASASLKKKTKTALDSEDTTPKQVHCDWKINLGEALLDIRIGRCFDQDSATSFDILVLGEFTLFGIKPHGEIFMQKRLGFHPSTLCLYRRPASTGSNASAGPMDNVLVASHSKLWAVFKDKSLLWSAWAPTVPVALHVVDVGGIDGMVVSLDSEGALSVCYMGTDPPSTAVVAPDTKEINYEEMDEEHRQLLNVIRRAQGERRTEPKERVLLRAQVPTILDAVPERGDDFQQRRKAGATESSATARGVQLTMRVYLTYTGSSKVTNVTLSIRAPENVLVNEESIAIGTIDGRSSTPLIVPVVLRPSATAMPTSLDVVIAAAYTLETGQPRVSQCRVRLPMCLACRLVPPVKSSTFKFTLETNQDPLELTNLFEDMFHQPFCSPDWAKQIVGGSGTNVLSFQYYNGVEATILVSKNAGRYRIQSTELEALWLVSSELVERLRQFFAPHPPAESKHDPGSADLAGSGVEIFYQEPLPLADFFGTIDQHFALRKEKLEISAELNDRAHQFRVIQKRLLVRYKDRNPSSINCLDALLHGTYEQLLALSHRMEDVDAKLLSASNRLSCCVRLILMLIQFRFHLDDENARLLSCYLSPEIHEFATSGTAAATAVDGQGWEERTDAAMTELLRTLLAKQPAANGNKDTAAVVQDLSLPEDTKKLKKHITIVCDRLGKGVTLIPTTTATAAASEQRAEK